MRKVPGMRGRIIAMMKIGTEKNSEIISNLNPCVCYCTLTKSYRYQRIVTLCRSASMSSTWWTDERSTQCLSHVARATAHRRGVADVLNGSDNRADARLRVEHNLGFLRSQIHHRRQHERLGLECSVTARDRISSTLPFNGVNTARAGHSSNFEVHSLRSA